MTAVLQLIYELRENWRGRVDGWESKALQEVLAYLKIDRNGKRDEIFFVNKKTTIVITMLTIAFHP